MFQQGHGGIMTDADIGEAQDDPIPRKAGRGQGDADRLQYLDPAACGLRLVLRLGAQPFRDMALVRQTAVEYDSLQPQQVIDRLRGLADKGSPWLGSAGEMVAVAYLRQNKLKQAGQTFALVAQTDGVPESLRARAVQMAGSLGVDAAPAGDRAVEEVRDDGRDHDERGLNRRGRIGRSNQEREGIRKQQANGGEDIRHRTRV